MTTKSTLSEKRKTDLRGRTLLTTCLNLKKGESVLIAFDKEGTFNARILSESAERLGLVVVEFPITKDDENERPVRELSLLMRKSDVTIFCVNQRRIVTYGHSDARITAIKKGTRVGFLTQDVIETPSATDLKKIHSRSSRLGELLEKTNHVTMITGKKHKRVLEFAIKDRKSFPLSSILVNRGDWGALPDYAEAAISPIEDSAEGGIEIDGMIMGYGKLKSPLVLQFSRGQLTAFKGKEFSQELRRILESKDDALRVLCELGLGANNLRREIRGEFDDKKMLGSAHIAIGDNHTIGGKNKSNLHIDFLVTNPRIFFDGAPINLNAV